MNFYKELELVLQAKSVHQKVEMFEKFYEHYKSGEVTFDDRHQAIYFKEPSYSEFCKIISPQDVPKRNNLTTQIGQINLLHAIAHIEYSAIDLALDGAYRFKGLPKAYYDDWLEVAADEVRHFLMLEKLLIQLDAQYGDIEVHNALFEASQRTQTLIERMAVVPRYLEANGLDATPLILKKLKKLPKNQMLSAISATLKVILEEEINHVKKGDIWFTYACKEEDVNKDVYFEVIKKYYPRGFLHPKNLNVEARKEAGFSCGELNHIAQEEVC